MDIINLLWNATQQMEIQEVKDVSENAKFTAQNTALEVAEQTHLQYVQQLDKLGLICQAMWSLVQERTGLTEQDLLERVTELDLKDGVLDGKYTNPPVDCPKCNAKICKKFNRCLFCGEEYTEGTVFDSI